MGNAWRIFAFALLASFICGPASAAKTRLPNAPKTRPLETCAPGQIIVQYRGAAPARDAEGKATAARPKTLAALDAKFGLKSRRPLGIQYSGKAGKAAAAKLANPARPTAALVASLEILEFGGKAAPAEIAKAYAADPEIARAEPNYISSLAAPFVPNDPFFLAQLPDLSAAQFPDAWGIQKGSATTLVAVLDSGCDSHHPDLKTAISALSFDFIASSFDISDNLGHGTRVASLIGAVGNEGKGMAGAAFGVKLLILDIGGFNGQIFDSDVIQALDYAAGAGAKVANMSFVNPNASSFVDSAIQAAAQSMIHVASVGNDGSNAKVLYPAGYDNVVGVAATVDGSSARAPFSNYNGPGVDYADIAACGTTLFGCIPGGQYDMQYGSGTSFAAPLVSAAAALLCSKYPTQSAASLTSQLLGSALPTSGGVYTKYGKLNALRALTLPLTPSIQLVDATVEDDKAFDADNDADGYLDKKETTKIVVTLKNTGPDAANVSATLATTDPFVVGGIANHTVALGDLHLGQTVDNKATPFANVVISNAATARRIPFTLTLDGDGGFHSVLNFDLSTENEIPVAGHLGNTQFENIATYRVTNDLTFDGSTTIPLGARFKIDQGVNIVVGPGATLSAQGTDDKPIVFTSSVAPRFYADPVYTKNLGPQSDADPDLSVYAEKLHVSPAGNNTTGTGAIGNPYMTVDGAFAGHTASSGHRIVILVAGGEYHNQFSGTLGVLATPYVDIFGGYVAGPGPAEWTRDLANQRSVLNGLQRLTVMRAADHTILDGLTFYEGDTTAGPGGGVICDGVSPTIRNCAFLGNYVGNTIYGGGGLYLNNSSAIVENCVFTGNFANFGSAVLSVLTTPGTSAPVFTRNLFCGNFNTDFGTLNFQGGSPVVEFNAICANKAVIFNSGLSIDLGTSLTLRGNLVAGGVVDLGCKDSTLTSCNNTFRDEVQVDGATGGTMKNCDMTRLTKTDAAPASIAFANNNIQIDNIGGLPAGNIQAPGEHYVGKVAWGSFKAVFPDTVPGQWVIEGIPARLTPGALKGHVLEIADTIGFQIVDNTDSTITIRGDARYLSTRSDANYFTISDYHLQPNTPLSGAGVGPGADVLVPTEDMDHDSLVVPVPKTVCDIGFDQINSSANYPGWGRFTVDGSENVDLSNVVIENGHGFINKAHNTKLDRMTARRNRECGIYDNPGFALTAPITHSSAVENFGDGKLLGAGGGIDVQNDILDCTASGNVAIDFSGVQTKGALSGLGIVRCTATDNGCTGIYGASVSYSTASGNGKHGIIILDGAGHNLISFDNAIHGIHCADVGIVNSDQDLTDCLSYGNGGRGIEYDLKGSIKNCTVLGNQDYGIYYYNSGFNHPDPGAAVIQNCVVSGNGALTVADGIAVDSPPSLTTAVDVIGCTVENNKRNGISNARNITQSRVRKNGNTAIDSPISVKSSYIAENDGVGLQGRDGFPASFDVQGCSVILNMSTGIYSPRTVNDSWIEDNAAEGIVGLSATAGAVTNSVIRFNSDTGLLNLFSATHSSIYENAGGGVQAMDDIGPSSASKDFSNNYWGPSVDAAAVNFDLTEVDQPFISDALDVAPTGGSTLRYLKVSDTEIQPDPLAPESAPAYLIFINTSPLSPSFTVIPGLTTFTLYFSQQMDVTVNPRVTFDGIAPFTKNLVAPAPGWVNYNTWVGAYPIDDTTGSGNQWFRVAGAVSAAGFHLPDNTSVFNNFYIDTSGQFVANNGVAQLTGPVGKIIWDGEGGVPRPAGKGDKGGKGVSSAPTTIGFNIVRSTDGVNYVQINANPIPNPGTGLPAKFLDVPLSTSTIYFWKVYRVLPDGTSVIWSGPFLQVTGATFAPTYVVTDVSVAEGDGGGAPNAVFTITLYGQTGASAVDYITSDGSATAPGDYTAKSGTLAFANGTTTRTITVPIVKDTVPEGNETFTLTLLNPTNGAAIGVDTATCTIINDESTGDPRVSFLADSEIALEGNTTINVPIHLDNPPLVQARVDWFTQDGKAKAGQDYVAASGTVIFQPGETGKNIQISLLNDAVWEGGENFSVRMDTPVHAQLANPVTHTITIVQPELQHILNKIFGIPDASLGADVNGDGVVDVADIVKTNLLHAP